MQSFTTSPKSDFITRQRQRKILLLLSGQEKLTNQITTLGGGGRGGGKFGRYTNRFPKYPSPKTCDIASLGGK